MITDCLSVLDSALKTSAFASSSLLDRLRELRVLIDVTLSSQLLFSTFLFDFLVTESTEIEVGGGNRSRTCDLLNANQTLCQLSYAPTRIGGP